MPNQPFRMYDIRLCVWPHAHTYPLTQIRTHTTRTIDYVHARTSTHTQRTCAHARPPMRTHPRVRTRGARAHIVHLRTRTYTRSCLLLHHVQKSSSPFSPPCTSTGRTHQHVAISACRRQILVVDGGCDELIVSVFGCGPRCAPRTAPAPAPPLG